MGVPAALMLVACAGSAPHRVAVAPPRPDDAVSELPASSGPTLPPEAPPPRPEEPSTEPPTGIPGLLELQLDLAGLQAEYDIPLEINEAVVGYVRMFQSAEFRPRFLRWLARAERYLPRFRAILRTEGVPEDTVYMAMVESGLAAHATSPASAVGPWQFLSETGSRYGLVQDAWVDERRDPEKATAAAARFLKDLHRRTGDWHLAWAAYNAGPGRISRAMEAGFSSFWDMAMEDGLLPQETRSYVPKILAAAIVAKHPEAFGFRKEEIEPERWIDGEVVTIARAAPLATVAEAARVSVDELRALNPELLGRTTPPRAYGLRIPLEKVAVFAARWPALSAREAEVRVAASGVRVAASRVRVAASRVPVAAYRVKQGETLWSLSRRLGVTVGQLASWNGIETPERHNLLAGRLLTVREARRAPSLRPRYSAPASQPPRASSLQPASMRPRSHAAPMRAWTE